MFINVSTIIMWSNRIELYILLASMGLCFIPSKDVH